MTFVQLVAAVLVLGLSALSQQTSKAVTVPITLDHNRIVIDVYLPLPDGTSKRVRAWVDSGSSELMMSQRVAGLFGPVNCTDQVCNATPPPEVVIGASRIVQSGVGNAITKGEIVTGGMKLSLAEIHTAHVPADGPKDAMIAGMSPEITLPSTVLRHNDVVFDYANREFTIGEPGTVKFKGKLSKVQVNAVGLVRVATRIEDQPYNLVLDTGASMSFISSELLSKWHTAHAAWPSMTGAVGAANVFGTPEETERFVLQLPSLRYGTSTLNQVSLASLSANLLEKFRQRTGADAVGLLGGDAFRNYCVGIDYAHSTVYLDRLTNAQPSDLNVVGLTLRPDPDGRYTVVAVADYKGNPSVPEVKPGDVLLGVDGAPATGATLGQVWSLLGGSPGQTRSLILERDGKRFTVDAPIRRFLAAQGIKDPPAGTVQKIPKKK
jgi:hypothetical protein